MKLKELERKYKNYDIICYGKPLKDRRKMSPWAYIHWEDTDNSEVVEYEVDNKQVTKISLTKQKKW